MHRSYTLAATALKEISGRQRQNVERLIKEIVAIKCQTETIALRLGYTDACKASIGTCGGWCCRRHFPKSLSPVDFLIALFLMSDTQQDALKSRIAVDSGNSCPMLINTGCMMSFEQRPVVCTNAYPCFMGRSYWLEKEKNNELINARYESIRIESAMHTFGTNG